MKKFSSKSCDKSLTQKSKELLHQQHQTQADPTQCLIFLSQIDNNNYNIRNAIVLKEDPGVSPWAHQNSENCFLSGDQGFQKSKTSSMLPFCLKRPKKGLTESLKGGRQRKVNNQKCKTTITRYPSEQSNPSKILILQNKENMPESQKNLKKIQRKEEAFIVKKKKIKSEEKNLLKEMQWKNIIENVSDFNKLKKRIIENIEKEAVVAEYGQKPLPLPNAVKPLSRFMKKKKVEKEKKIMDYSSSKNLMNPIFGKYVETMAKLEKNTNTTKKSYLI